MGESLQSRTGSRMSSYSTSYTVTTTTTSSDSRNMRAASAGSDLDDLYFKSFCMTDGDRFRMGREFFSPAPISLTGNYWPRYSNCDKSVPQTGSAYESLETSLLSVPLVLPTHAEVVRLAVFSLADK